VYGAADIGQEGNLSESGEFDSLFGVESHDVHAIAAAVQDATGIEFNYFDPDADLYFGKTQVDDVRNYARIAVRRMNWPRGDDAGLPQKAKFSVFIFVTHVGGADRFDKLFSEIPTPKPVLIKRAWFEDEVRIIEEEYGVRSDDVDAVAAAVEAATGIELHSDGVGRTGDERPIEVLDSNVSFVTLPMPLIPREDDDSQFEAREDGTDDSSPKEYYGRWYGSELDVERGYANATVRLNDGRTDDHVTTPDKDEFPVTIWIEHAVQAEDKFQKLLANMPEPRPVLFSRIWFDDHRCFSGVLFDRPHGNSDAE
jgi:hypothetical protein